MFAILFEVKIKSYHVLDFPPGGAAKAALVFEKLADLVSSAPGDFRQFSAILVLVLPLLIACLKYALFLFFRQSAIYIYKKKHG